MKMTSNSWKRTQVPLSLVDGLLDGASPRHPLPLLLPSSGT